MTQSRVLLMKEWLDARQSQNIKPKALLNTSLVTDIENVIE
jgi:hypothetical protein